MNVLALLLALLAIVLLLLDHFEVSRRDLTDLSLAILAAAAVVQLVWPAHHVVVH